MQIDPAAEAPEIHLIRYTADAVEEVDPPDVESIASHREGGGVLWVNVNGLGDAGVIRSLGEMFDLHRLALADVVHVDQRAKVEAYDDHLFIVIRMILANQSLGHEQLSIFLGRDFVLTFQERAGDCFEPVRERIRKARGRIRQAGADFLAYALIDAVVDSYFPPLEAFGDRLERIEAEVLDRPSFAVVQQIHIVKRELLVVRRAVWPLREAINSLIRDDSPLIRPDTRLYLRDCYDHTIQVMDMVETFRELSSSQMELYVSTVSQKTNEIMKVLTIFASIFIPLTFIAGIYGMNFDPEYSPLNMPEIRWFFGYPAALLFMAAVSAGLLWFFWRRGWIGSELRSRSSARFGEVAPTPDESGENHHHHQHEDTGHHSPQR